MEEAGESTAEDAIAVGLWEGERGGDLHVVHQPDTDEVRLTVMGQMERGLASNVQPSLLRDSADAVAQQDTIPAYRIHYENQLASISGRITSSSSPLRLGRTLGWRCMGS
jgi:hypothetical protein